MNATIPLALASTLLCAWGTPEAQAPTSRRTKSQPVEGIATAGTRTWKLVAGAVVRGAGEGAIAVSRRRHGRPVAMIRGATQICELEGHGETSCHDVGEPTPAR